MDHWDQEAALRSGRARTRNGKDVIGLRKATLVDSRNNAEQDILIGDVIVTKRPYKKGQFLKSEGHYWTNGGLGHGDDDLVNS